MEKRNRKVFYGIFALLIVSLFFISNVSADGEFWACFPQGTQINYCNNYKPSVTCSDSGGCSYCMSVYRADENCYIHGSWPKCQQLSQECTVGGTGEIDGEAPVITLENPVNGTLYQDTNVPFTISLNEVSDIYYLDLINGRGRWTRVCTNCASYDRERRFNEGLNELRVRATDGNGNENFTDVSFFIDSKEPQVGKTEPTKGFANGDFRVEFKEENPDILTLHYGVDGDMKNKSVDLSSENCFADRTNTVCETNVDLSEFEEQEITYYFVLEDIAGNTDESKHEMLMVDNTAPLISNVEYVFDGKKGSLVVEVSDANLDEVEYIDNSDARPKWKRVCSKVEDGICEGKVRFADGLHNVEIMATDDAGSVSTYVMDEFFTDSKVPKIKSTLPKKGYANGEFFVEFDEENPVAVVLFYGNQEVGIRNKVLNLENECTESKYYDCSTIVDLSDYDGSEIQYQFSVQDVVGSVDTSRLVELDVDITNPVLNNNVQEDLVIDGRRVEFLFDVTELNFDEIQYMDLSDSNPRWKRLCSRLDSEGICSVRKTFREGFHEVSLLVLDEAGNNVGTNVEFEIFG